MPSLEARIETERPSRYLIQFCKHAAAMGGAGGHAARMHLRGKMARREMQVEAEWSDTHGTVTFTPWGRCVLAAGEGALSLRIEAPDEDGLRQIQGIITRDFERFSRRHPLVVTWDQPEASDDDPRPEGGEAAPDHRRGAAGWMRANRQVIGLAAAAALAVALHLGLAGTILAESQWAGLATDVVLAIIALKVVLIVLARFGLRRRKAARSRRNMSEGST
jgi:hypothetical protein